jgi:hypothetical protein
VKVHSREGLSVGLFKCGLCIIHSWKGGKGVTHAHKVVQLYYDVFHQINPEVIRAMKYKKRMFIISPMLCGLMGWDGMGWDGMGWDGMGQ